uniref:Y-family DNA polymerase n=1 Tax=Desertibaculum subflavum TaxID=2268458 RepID=UPI0013C4BE9B
ALASLPLGALRLPPETVQALSRVGLRAVGELAALPRAPLARRFGPDVVQRLDQAFGRVREPISPQQPPAQFRARIAFAEAIGRREDIEEAVRRLLRPLMAELEDAGKGVRRLDLVAYRVDGGCQRVGIGTAAPSRSAPHLFRLLAEHFEHIDPGFGIEVLALEAAAIDPLEPQQLGAGGIGLGDLIDRLQNRLGPDRVVSLLPADSHVPEHAVVVRPADAAVVAQGGSWRGGDWPASNWPERGERPLALLAAPERIEAEPAEAAAEPPQRFTWRRVMREVVRAEGPERIAPEWWRMSGTQRTRDYWRIEDAAGRRYWVYRDVAGWYLQGLFA